MSDLRLTIYDHFIALFITLGLISRPSAKMLSLIQHPDYARHLSVYAVSRTVRKWGIPIGKSVNKCFLTKLNGCEHVFI
jgi:hypothetical protein